MGAKKGGGAGGLYLRGGRGDAQRAGAKACQGLGLLLRVGRDLGKARSGHSTRQRISPGSRQLISWAHWQPPPPLFPRESLDPASGTAGSMCFVSPVHRTRPLLGAPVVLCGDQPLEEGPQVRGRNGMLGGGDQARDSCSVTEASDAS